MANVTVLKFMQQTAADESLRQQLEALLGVGDGDISSSAELDPEESAALSQRAPRVAEFAAQQGYSFSADELLDVIDAFQQYQAGKLSEAEFAQKVGLTSGKQLGSQTQGVFQRLTKYLVKTYLGVNSTV
ncbi:MAG: hypothetical protein F6J97_10670 [Leptolyngbya sp. SIO4C1]|nr:hypothetical protein [Leptolyngbya sp. SIO4C1]